MRSRIFCMTGIAAAALLLFMLLATPSLRADDASVSYPDGYRTWTFLHSSLVPAGAAGFSKSPCVNPCTNGIFHFYANELAMKGLRTGMYEDGAVIAEEMLELLVGEKGNGGEGRRVLTAVMVKDSRRYAATGGWASDISMKAARKMTSMPKPSKRAISATPLARTMSTFSRNTSSVEPSKLLENYAIEFKFEALSTMSASRVRRATDQCFLQCGTNAT